MGSAPPPIGVCAATTASSQTRSWEVTVVEPTAHTAAVRRAAGFHLAQHSAVVKGKDHRVLFDIKMPNSGMATPGFQWADVSAMPCSVPLYEVLVGVGFALHSSRSATVFSESTANSRVHRLLTFDTRGLFLSIAWEFLCNGVMSMIHVHVRC